MLCPAVARLEVDAAAPELFGLRIAARFLQTEGVHAEHRVIAGHTRAPCRQSPGDAVAQHSRVTGVKVDQVPGLQGQRIARVVDAQVFQGPACIPPTPFDQFADGLEMRALALIGGQREGVLVDLPRDRYCQRLGAEQVQIGLEHVTHHERRAGGQRPIRRRDGIIDVAAQLAERGLEQGDAVAIRTSQCLALEVGVFHCGVSCRVD